MLQNLLHCGMIVQRVVVGAMVRRDEKELQQTRVVVIVVVVVVVVVVDDVVVIVIVIVVVSICRHLPISLTLVLFIAISGFHPCYKRTVCLHEKHQKTTSLCAL